MKFSAASSERERIARILHDNAAQNLVVSSLKLATLKAELLKLNPKMNIVEIRGNVNTRIRKMEEGYCDAMIMAATGLKLPFQEDVPVHPAEHHFTPVVAEAFLQETERSHTGKWEFTRKRLDLVVEIQQNGFLES